MESGKLLHTLEGTFNITVNCVDGTENRPLMHKMFAGYKFHIYCKNYKHFICKNNCYTCLPCKHFWGIQKVYCEIVKYSQNTKTLPEKI